MNEFEAIVRVLIVGLVLGAGLPALFAVGLRLFTEGGGDADADGTTHAGNPVVRYAGLTLFVLIAAVIVLAILWISRNTIDHYFDVNLFPFAPKK
ncbi:hypothetical protein [Williamsia sterculiae]|uniref:Transmembrane protein n=1 Tax=Williamsia sterculiae TaxID=1344003 RepID=A0A1N7CYR3_9NOCA|nr:hypothetical protein [Williamsia sterculiae]SIR68788.1 hypothetical protein SAMN05445060_0455 [Williamsia sterculiae]